jgi:hypothetical protein
LKCHWQITPSECIVGQNHLLLFWSPATSLVCHWSVDQFSGRGLLHESWLLRHLKGPVYQQDRDRGSEIALLWRLSDRYQGWCVAGCADRGRRVVRKKRLTEWRKGMWCHVADWMEEGYVMSCGWQWRKGMWCHVGVPTHAVPSIHLCGSRCSL